MSVQLTSHNKLSHRKPQGIKPYRFRIAIQVIRVIRVICEICGLKGNRNPVNKEIKTIVVQFILKIKGEHNEGFHTFSVKYVTQ